MDGAVNSNVQVHSSNIGAENMAMPHNRTDFDNYNNVGYAALTYSF